MIASLRPCRRSGEPSKGNLAGWRNTGQFILGAAAYTNGMTVRSSRDRRPHHGLEALDHASGPIGAQIGKTCFGFPERAFMGNADEPKALDIVDHPGGEQAKKV